MKALTFDNKALLLVDTNFIKTMSQLDVKTALEQFDPVDPDTGFDILHIKNAMHMDAIQTGATYIIASYKNEPAMAFNNHMQAYIDIMTVRAVKIFVDPKLNIRVAKVFGKCALLGNNVSFQYNMSTDYRDNTCQLFDIKDSLRRNAMYK